MKTITYTVDDDPDSELAKVSAVNGEAYLFPGYVKAVADFQVITYVREALPPCQFSTPQINSTTVTGTQPPSVSHALTAGQKPNP